MRKSYFTSTLIVSAILPSIICAMLGGAFMGIWVGNAKGTFYWGLYVGIVISQIVGQAAFWIIQAILREQGLITPQNESTILPGCIVSFILNFFIGGIIGGASALILRQLFIYVSA